MNTSAHDWIIDASARFRQEATGLRAQDLLSLAAAIILCLWIIRNKAYSEVTKEVSDELASGTAIQEQLIQTDNDCIVFYGSQTGTAESFALRFVKEGKERLGLRAMAADLHDYEFKSLKDVTSDKVAIFVLATYGEGEPTDNAVTFFQKITDDASSGTETDALVNLRYAIFGLGNRNYEFFNAMARNVDDSLQKMGAERLGCLGEGDEAQGTLEEDFMSWQEPVWTALKDMLGLSELHTRLTSESTFIVNETDDYAMTSSEVRIEEHGKSIHHGPFDATKPLIASISNSMELFNAPGRNCLHMDIDIFGSNLTYETGDHIAIWPTNSDLEVNRLLGVLGLLHKRRTIIDIRYRDATVMIPFPTPTTYDALLKFYLNICGPVSRQSLSSLVNYAPTEAAKSEIKRLSQDKDYFTQSVSKQARNLAQVLLHCSQGSKWLDLPIHLVLDGLHKLMPRYYSISSSAREQPSKVSITAVVESTQFPAQSEPFLGTCTNYLLALKRAQHDESISSIATHDISGPRGQYNGFKIPIQIHKSKFRLPHDPSTPVIMIGPGTGVAPFRGFVRERAYQAREGAVIGPMVLFYGCRHRDEDFLYQTEWKALENDMKGVFRLVNAFSRERAEKEYVQHKIMEMGTEINSLLDLGAHVYICGDAANMAREVKKVLAQVISQERGVTIYEAECTLRELRASHRFQEDVW